MLPQFIPAWAAGFVRGACSGNADDDVFVVVPNSTPERRCQALVLSDSFVKQTTALPRGGPRVHAPGAPGTRKFRGVAGASGLIGDLSRRAYLRPRSFQISDDFHRRFPFKKSSLPIRRR
jgi:hypothetical protein